MATLKTNYQPGEVFNASDINATNTEVNGKQALIDAEHKLSYNLLSDTPSIPSLTTKDFTEDNIVITSEYKEGCQIMTKGDETEDTLVWESGSITFDLGTRLNSPASGNFEISMIDIDTYKSGHQKPVYQQFSFTEPTEGAYTKMIWNVTNGSFTCTLVTAEGSSVILDPIDVSNYICHYEGYITGCLNVAFESTNAKLSDPIYPLPHDTRLDYAFDETGYVVVGNKKIQLRDLTQADVKSLDWNHIHYFYDGTSTYFYDFYRKDFSMVYYSDLTDSNVELLFINPNTTITMGVYDQGTSYTPHSMGQFDTTGTKAELLNFTAKWDANQKSFVCQWKVQDVNHDDLYTSPEYLTTGPIGFYLSVPGKHSIKEFLYGFNKINAQYVRYTAPTSTEPVSGDPYRDNKTLIAQNRETFVSVFLYGLGVAKNPSDLAKNYYMTNGNLEVAPNREDDTCKLPNGTWKISWFGIDDAPFFMNQFDEDSTEGDNHGVITNISLVRDDVFVLSTIVTFANGQTYAFHPDYVDPNDWAAVVIEYTCNGDSLIPECLSEPLYTNNFHSVFEKKYAMNLADSLNYGAVKIDNDSIKSNSEGQLYFNSETEYSELLTSSKTIIGAINELYNELHPSK